MKNLTSLYGRFINGGKFTGDKRFVYKRDDKKRQSSSPGPAVYNIKTTFDEKLSQPNGKVFGKTKKIVEPIVHFKGFEREALGKHSPGPGVYSHEKLSNFSKKGGKINPVH